MVAMKALMERLNAEEVGTSRVGGDRAATLPAHGVCVIGTGVSGTLTGVYQGGVPFLLNNRCREFKVCNRDVAGAILRGNQLVHNILGEVEAPEGGWNRKIAAGEHDAAHTMLTGVCGSMTDGRKLDELIETSRARGQIFGDPGKIRDCIMDPTVQAQAALGGLLESELELAEQTTGAGKSNGHRPELAE
jgi:hypothetical protein